MPELSPEDQAIQALRCGLRAQPVPTLSPDFDTRILAALKAPAPGWLRWGRPAVPVLISASCSLMVTLALLQWSLSAPIGLPAAGHPSVAAIHASLPSLDALLDRPGLCAGSLARTWEPLPPTLPPANRRPKSRRRAQLWPATLTLA